MTIEGEFRQRIAEVVQYLLSLQRLERDHAKPGLGFYRAAETITASRASSFIMIYNCVEFGVRESIIAIRNEIRLRNTPYASLKAHWQEELAKARFNERLTQGSNHALTIREISLFPAVRVDWLSDIARIPFSGSIDNAELLRLAEKIENAWRPPKTCMGGQDLVLVKKMRNDLAHGSETFENVGSQFSTEDIIEKVRRIRTFVASAVHSLERYREKGAYCRN